MLWVCFPLEMVAIGGVLSVYSKIPLAGFDWLSGQVAMVKAVIKAIKAAGVGLNGSSDCSCCHKLNKEGEIEQGRMGKTWKDGISGGKKMQQEKENKTKNKKNPSSVGEQNVISCAQSKAGTHLALNWFLFTAEEIKGYSAPTITSPSRPRQEALSHCKRQRARSSSQPNVYHRSLML